MEKLVIAVDPGREKCGLAVVHREQGVLFQQVISTDKLPECVDRAAAKYRANTIVLGNKTTSRTASDTLANLTIRGQKLNIITVDEHRSTDEARQRYWQANPPTGLKRLIPVTMQVPPVPVDDYVAVILAERYFAQAPN